MSRRETLARLAAVVLIVSVIVFLALRDRSPVQAPQVDSPAPTVTTPTVTTPSDGFEDPDAPERPERPAGPAGPAGPRPSPRHPRASSRSCASSS